MTTTQELVLNKLFDVSGLVAVVTGGGSGIGLMATQGLVANGACVYIVGRRMEVLDRVVNVYSKTEGAAGKIIGIKADITDPQSVDGLAKELERREPNGINILVNNAGVSLEGEKRGQMAKLDFTSAESVRSFLVGDGRDIWHQTFLANVISHHFVTAALLPLLSKGRQNTLGHSSSVINVSSISGSTKHSSGGQYAYSVSKAALTHLTRELASTLYPLGVRVNAIEPGFFPSEMTTGGSDENQKSKLEGVGHKFPAGRTGQEGDIASVILYLGSRAGTYLNGEIIHVDGGALLVSPSTT